MIRSYLDGRTAPGDFAQRYQDGYQQLGALDEPTFVALDRLFFVCEDYYDDPALRDPGDPTRPRCEPRRSGRCPTWA